MMKEADTAKIAFIFVFLRRKGMTENLKTKKK